jgi:hypothetical protein
MSKPQVRATRRRVAFDLVGRQVDTNIVFAESVAEARGVVVYADSGTHLTIFAQADGPSKNPGTGATISLSGYLVPMP